MIADESYICWHCGETLPTLAIYKEHCLQHSASVRVYTCDICQKKNHNIGRLIGHLKGHLVPRHKCDVCGNCFGRPELLEAHVQTHVNQPNHECLICNKSFVTSDRLQCHMRTHSGEKRFTCELCGKCFSQKMSFDYHKRWHAGEKPYECDICGRRTICYGDLKKHKRMHSDKRPYVCEVCGKSFRFISNLNRHRKGHSGKRLYVCQVCGRSFIYNEGLRDHIKAGRCPGMKAEAGAGGKSSNRGPRPRNSNAIVSISMMNLTMEGAPCSVVPPPPPQAQQTQMPIFTSKTSLNPANLPSSLAPALMSVAPSSSIAPLNQQLQLPLPTSATLVQVPAPPQHAQAQHIQHGQATALQEAFMTEYTPWPQYMIRNNIAVSEGGDGTQPGNNVVIVPQFY
ncbi:Zinc finger protein 436 [Plakobranchus ocellatus]|uniref:Zinc finger protein 436 n=1 Tax=Plakobranchus ocellatus TaxID=259542 RepID=A0AAV3YWV9_9GAST|nr:Zinc finger protein 436 [Plakobranchus ocellatus]